MTKLDIIKNYLDEMFPNPKCELNYNKDYELLISTVLSAQTTDKKVNQATEVLYKKYNNLEALANADLEDIKTIIPIGTYNKKSVFVKEIAKYLLDNCDGKVPIEREKLESIPGVGRKTANLILSELFNYPAIVVDTHVSRVSKRLGIADVNDDVSVIEKKLMDSYDKSLWCRLHLQLVLFGRYHCKAIRPECDHCKLKDICKKDYL